MPPRRNRVTPKSSEVCPNVTADSLCGAANLGCSRLSGGTAGCRHDCPTKSYELSNKY
jgi:hypothetical protein